MGVSIDQASMPTYSSELKLREIFSKEKRYLFVDKNKKGRLRLMNKKLFKTDGSHVVFPRFPPFFRAFYWINADEILGVRDDQEGSVHIKGVAGAYKILKPHLFNRYVTEKIIVLKN